MKRFLAARLRRLADVMDPPPQPTWWQQFAERVAAEPRGPIAGGACTACWQTGVCGCVIGPGPKVTC